MNNNTNKMIIKNRQLYQNHLNGTIPSSIGNLVALYDMFVTPFIF